MHERLLIWLLRLFGGVTCLAMFAALLPTEWMADIHAWLGVGVMPQAPIVEYLTRSISLLYAIHGGATLLTSTDVRRFAPMIAYLAVADAAMGVALIAVDIHARLPWHWTAIEGPSVVIPCALLYELNRRVAADVRKGPAS